MGGSTSCVIVCLFIYTFAATVGWAAKAPTGTNALEKESTHIVIGQVVSVGSNIRKSNVEGGAGHKDEIFSIMVKVKSTTKGEGIKVDDEIQIVAWKPHTRIGIAGIGLQGHEVIPKKGQTATFYLKKNGKKFEPLMPNGIDIQPQAEEKIQ